VPYSIQIMPMTLGEKTISEECPSKPASAFKSNHSDTKSSPISIEGSSPVDLPPTLIATDSKEEIMQLYEINPYRDTSREHSARNPRIKKPQIEKN
jgi:hypothetical protein